MSRVPARAAKAGDMTREPDPRAWARYGMARRALAAVATAFARRGVDVLAVKGVVTSDWLYDDRAARPLGDVDVRIRPRDFGAAIGIARNEGWRTDRCLRAYGSLMVQVEGVSIDIESYFGPPSLSALSVDRVLSRATRAADGSFHPEVHDHAVLLTINVFKDKMASAPDWALEDTRRVVTARGVDLDTFVERAREARVEALTWLVADWMSVHRDSDAWRRVRAQLGGDSPPRPLYAALIQRLWARGRASSGALRVLSRAASDDPSRWFSALARSAACEVELQWELRRRGHR